MKDELQVLREENTSLQKTIQELENTSKMLVHRDIDLRDAYEELKQLDKEKSEFVSIAAHQLRTPLTSVRFAIQILSESLGNSLDEIQNRSLEQARIAVDRMFSMIEDLLTVDALDYGNLKLVPETVAPEKIISDIVTNLEPIILQKKLQVHLNFAYSPMVMKADPKRLKDAFSNLIDNAVKYTPTEGAITISTKYTGTHVIIEISDNGIGIDESQSSQLFKKFSRLENAKRVDANGSGLGLYICKKIIERHNGTISYERLTVQGSTFKICLPL